MARTKPSHVQREQLTDRQWSDFSALMEFSARLAIVVRERRATMQERKTQ